MPGQQIRSATVLSQTAGQTSSPVFCPTNTEITVTIASVNGIVQGALAIDSTNSADALVSAGTATWTNGILSFVTAGTFVQKVYAPCWVRVRCTQGATICTIDPAGNTITPAANPFLPLSTGAAYSAAEVLPGTGDGATDNAPLWNASCGLTGTLLNQTTKVRYGASGNFVHNALLDSHPLFSAEMFARGGIVMTAGRNLPSLTSGPAAGMANSAGAPAALVRILAVAPSLLGDTPTPLAYETSWGGFNMNGNGNHQTGVQHGVRKPNPNPANNSIDPDPTYSTNKDYVLGFFHDQDITNFTGDGLVGEAGNGRGSFLNHRSLGNTGNGYTFSGNDLCFYGHSAAGGNGGWGYQCGNGSGYHFTTNNAWASPKLRALTSGAVFFNQSKAFDYLGGELNDWMRMQGDANPLGGAPNGANAFWRNGTVMGVCFAPFNEIFLSDGVAVDMTVGGADSRLQAQIGVALMQDVNFIGNNFSRTTATNKAESGYPQFPFSTPSNVGGQLDGSYGTAFQYLYDIGQSAMVNCIDTVCSAPNVKPWVNTVVGLSSYNDPTPYNSHNGAQTNYLFMDSYATLTRIGAKGPQHAHFMAACNENAFPNTTYVTEIGDSTQPAGVPYRSAYYGMSEFGNVVQYMDNAFTGTTTVNAGTRNIKVGDAYQFFTTPGGGIASYTVNMPIGANASYELTLVFFGGPIASLSWSLNGGAFPTFPAAIPPVSTSGSGVTIIRAIWRHDTGKWYFIGTQAGDYLSVSGRTDGAFVSSGVIGERIRGFTSDVAAVALPQTGGVGTPTNVLTGGLPLTPGVWRIDASINVKAAGGSPIITAMAWGINTVANAIPGTKDEGFGARQYANLAAVGNVASERCFTIVSILINTTYYAVVECDYSGAGASCAGWGSLVATRIG